MSQTTTIWIIGGPVIITTNDDIFSKADSLVLMDLVMSALKLKRKEYFRT